MPVAAKPKLFEYAVVHHPTDDEGKPNGKSKIVVDLQRVLAASEQEAVITAARKIPEEYLNALEDVEIIVRPF